MNTNATRRKELLDRAGRLIAGNRVTDPPLFDRLLDEFDALDGRTPAVVQGDPPPMGGYGSNAWVVPEPWQRAADQDGTSGDGVPEASWRAVRLALEQVAALPGVQLPALEFSWDDARCPPDANAACVFEDDGRITVCLRSDQDPVDLERSCLHELMHALDAGRIRAGMSRQEAEERAGLAAALMSGRPWSLW